MYLDHELDAESLARFQEQLTAWPVKRAWLVRKRLEIFPERPLYVLGVERKVPWWRTDDEKLGRELQDALSERLETPGESFIVVLNGQKKKTWQLFSQAAGSQILPA